MSNENIEDEQDSKSNFEKQMPIEFIATVNVFSPIKTEVKEEPMDDSISIEEVKIIPNIIDNGNENLMKFSENGDRKLWDTDDLNSCKEEPQDISESEEEEIHQSHHISNSFEHGEKQFQCVHCDYKTTKKNYLIRHWKTKHVGEKKYKCTECPYKTTSSSNLKTHSKKHSMSKDKEYKCADCDYQTNIKGHLKRHLSVHDVIKPFMCDICYQSFRRKEQLQRHILSKHNNSRDKEYKCSKCNYKTNFKDHIKTHLVRHNDERPFECNVCNKSFKLSQSLKSHSYMHSKDRVFQCTHCDYKGNDKADFILHLEDKHLGSDEEEKPLNSIRKTRRGSRLKAQLKKYLAVNNKRFKCLQCDYQTDFQNNLRRHVFIHDNIKPYACHLCSKSFVQKVQLEGHIGSKHTTEKEYQCPSCDYKTNYKHNFKQHLIVHNKKPTEVQSNTE